MSDELKNNEFWKDKLDDETYRIAREKGTERSFTGKYWNHKEDGVYVCVCCGHPLFDSKTKYDSGSGWPSFYEPLTKSSLEEQADNSLARERTEVVCSNCGAHQGHVFNDGPNPTGLRYCINSASMEFKKRDDAK